LLEVKEVLVQLSWRNLLEVLDEQAKFKDSSQYQVE
jgi:hypothetical protein